MRDDYERQISRQYATLQDAVEILSLKLEATEARALKYEQALREIENTAINFSKGTIDSMMLIGMRMIEATARAALDKPGTEVEAVGAAPGWTVTVGYEEKT